MSNLFPMNNRLHAPYFIFMRCAGEYSDADLLAKFGIRKYKRVAEPPQHGPHATFFDSGDWTMLADDWYYTLWHMATTRPAIRRLSQFSDIYACSVGDCDHSFDFVYYQAGKLVRKYVVVADIGTNNSNVVENTGKQLPGELEALKLDDQLETVLSISDALGIRGPTPEDELRFYACPNG